MRTLVCLALVTGCAAQPIRLAGPIQPKKCNQSMPEVTDALGEKLEIGRPPPSVVVFLSRSSRDEGTEFVRELDERLLNRPVEIVGIVDVQKYRLMRGIVERQLAKSATEGRQRRRERREKHGIDASPAVVNRWHLVGDFNGTLLSRFSVEAEPLRPVAFVVSSACRVAGPYHEVGSVVTAVNQAAAKTARRSSASRRSHAAW